MFTDLRRRDIKFLIGMAPLSSSDWGRCGVGVEGYSAEGQSLSVARKLRALGGEVQYLGMDEPLYFGHVYGRKNACRSSIPEIAHDVAAKIRQVWSVFPSARIGDVEPVGIEYGDWLDDLEHWFDAFRSATGQELAFFRADVQWDRPWHEQIDRLSVVLHRRGIPLQVIYNGGGGHSDREWVHQAVEHFRQFESGGRGPPDAAVFQTWSQYPTHVLPESDPLTLTGLVDQYLQWRATRR
jgi:hypothetical protein